MLSPDVRALFKPPFKLYPDRRIHDANFDTAVTYSTDGSLEPRGWGRIRKLPDADKRMDEWEAALREITGAETDPNRVCELLNAAWTHGVEVADA